MEKGRKNHLLFSLLILIPTQCIFLPVNSLADYLTLAWNPNHEPDLAGYRIYYGQSSRNYDHITDVGNISSCSLSGLEPDRRYYVALTAYDISGNESSFSNEVNGISSPDTPTSNPSLVQTGSESGCFIATAAYGSYLSAHVKSLRDFRNQFLISNSLGRKCVHLYYQYSPWIANHIEKYGTLRFLARQALFPFIGMSLLSLKTTASQEFLLLPLCLLITFTVTLLFRLNQARPPFLPQFQPPHHPKS